MPDLNALPLDALFEALVKPEALRGILTLARAEDLSEAGDITSMSVVATGEEGRGRVVVRRDGVVAGLRALPMLFDVFDAEVNLSGRARDGQTISAGDVVAELSGGARDLLAIERTTLNLLGRLSGIATLTRAYVRAISGTSAVLCDTRKTAPGWRLLEKYAVRCGGGTLHRIGLHDAVLIKDNHLALVPAADFKTRIAAAVEYARRAFAPKFIEVEVDSLEQLDSLLAVAAGIIDIALLDNMTLEDLREAVRRRDRAGSTMQLEASGGVTLDTVRAIAETGVERISVGAITHSAPALDIGLDVGKA